MALRKFATHLIMHPRHFREQRLLVERQLLEKVTASEGIGWEKVCFKREKGRRRRKIFYFCIINKTPCGDYKIEDRKTQP